MNPKVDFYFEKAGKWQAAIQELRRIALASELDETLKWGCPCYTLNGANVMLIHTFKEYCALLFFKGALLPDPAAILIQQTEKVQAARQIRFTNTASITQQEGILQEYIAAAIRIEKDGLKVELKKTAEYEIPAEFSEALDGDSALKAAFGSLTPGRQRAYLMHFSAPKQAMTRIARIEKCAPDIFAGTGLNDL